MRLVSLRLFGFKTFAHTTTFTFDSNVIAIVGPNGSGKSNLVDAIRWVLGEQSTKSLRSTRTDDVIFAGNAKRKPLGMAEVSLTFDNSEGRLDLPFQEVQITRRAYRGGDIEYYVNKERVRLRDVHELLMGTGLGPGSYAIVSQGQIDQILVSKPSERRALFEETAGVNKFLARKAEALRRLEGTNTNVIRLNDLLREVEARIPELDSQVRRATKYRTLSARVRDLDVLSALRASQSRQLALQHAQDQAAQAAKTLEETTKTAVQADQGLDTARSEYTIAERAFTETRGAHEAAQALLVHAEREAATTRARLDTLETQATRADSELERRATDRERLTLRLHELEAQSEPLQQRVNELAQAEAAAATRLAEERRAVDALFTALREEETRANKQLAEETKAYAARESAQRDLVRSTAEHERISGEAAQVEALIAESAKTAAEAAELRLERTSAALTAEAAVTALEARFSQGAAALPNAQAQLRATSRELASLEARLHTLEELEANLEGHVPGTRAVIEASTRGDLNGIVGVVSSLVEVDEQYARALDIAFGAGVSNIIAQTSVAAEQAIEYLRNRELGRATLLPLDLVADRRGKELGALSRIPGVIAYAHELVRSEARFTGVVAFLVGRTLVVDTMRTGVHLARERQVRDTIVTLEGDQLIGGGALSGGRSRRGERSILARRAQTQTLREEHLPAQREALIDAEADLAKAAAELDLLTQQRDEARRAVVELRSGLRELEAREQGQRAQHAQAQSRAQALTLRRNELERSLAEIHRLLAALPQGESALQADAAERGRLDTALRTAQFQIVQSETALQELRRTLNAAREQLAVLGAQRAATQERCAALVADTDRQSGARAVSQSEIEALREQVEAITEERERLRVQAHAAAAIVTKAQQARDLLGSQIEAGERATRVARILEREHLEAGETVRRRVAELEAELGVLAQRWAESPISEEERVDTQTRYADAPDTILGELPKLRDDLVRLANVNLNAEADREEVAVREAELRNQLDDFAKARELLLNGIRELDETSQTQFLATFETVRKAFTATYAELFPGGEARMWLADEANPSESGIEISIQPPGKRMTSLAALSGGERAMTAVALIFALIRVKPSPFYLLDEIDAALDEMNVERFSRMVRSLAAEAQLLIVTHNKKTMELAQKMYGITMAEPGVSSVVTASFDRELLNA